jgi:hypothetical protein
VQREDGWLMLFRGREAVLRFQERHAAEILGPRCSHCPGSALVCRARAGRPSLAPWHATPLTPTGNRNENASLVL